MSHLSKKEALVVRELARCPGALLTAQEIAWAIGDDRPGGQYRVHATVQRVRAKFGADAILSVKGGGQPGSQSCPPGTMGYRLRQGASR